MYCTRCSLNNAMRIANFIVNLFGIGMIVYSLWLLKVWTTVMVQVGFPSLAIPKPWFIYTFLGVGILVCFGALLGYMVSNCMSRTSLSCYTLFHGLVLVIQVAAIVVILFRIDWQAVISKYIDEESSEIKNILMFHLYLCHLIGVGILISEAIVLILAIVLRALGPESRGHCPQPLRTILRQSFLVEPGLSPGLPGSSNLAFWRRFQV
ncbi:hypothetical protein IHE45_04G058400 [Dioscorea alata]|uniref:Uncharacterized protein n=1 Tax=Dioscorea alata TaxID=55571 RepID=A0ACB7WCL8_DIOAL|nr:hypothetical protein IHE45_04G058400 [Dioscorea alata]